MINKMHKVVFYKKKNDKVISMKTLYTGNYFDCCEFISKYNGDYKGKGKLDILTIFNWK